MTIMQEQHTAAETGTCPAWCTADDPYDPCFDGDIGPCTHTRPIGTLGVLIEQVDDGIEPVLIYVPELDFDSLHATADYARQLGADLIVAASVIEPGSIPTTVCPDGLAWCTDHAWSEDRRDSWHRRYVGESGVHVCQEDGKFALYPAPLEDNGTIGPDELRQAARDMIEAAAIFERVSA